MADGHHRQEWEIEEMEKFDLLDAADARCEELFKAFMDEPGNLFTSGAWDAEGVYNVVHREIRVFRERVMPLEYTSLMKVRILIAEWEAQLDRGFAYLQSRREARDV